MTYLENIKSLYSELKQSELYKSKNASVENMKNFEELLNKTIPQEQADIDFRITIKQMFNVNPNSFYNCIYSMPYLYLLIDGRTISRHFHLENIIYIKWNKQKNTYKVTLYQHDVRLKQKP